MRVYYFFRLPKIEIPDFIGLILVVGIVFILLWFFMWVMFNYQDKNIILKYQKRFTIIFWLLCFIPIKIISSTLVDDFKNDHTLLTMLGWFLVFFGWLIPYTTFSFFNKIKFK